MEKAFEEEIKKVPYLFQQMVFLLCGGKTLHLSSAILNTAMLKELCAVCPDESLLSM